MLLNFDIRYKYKVFSLLISYVGDLLSDITSQLTLEDDQYML